MIPFAIRMGLAGLITVGILLALEPVPRAPDVGPVKRHPRTDGTRFVDAAGRTFQWRGITAFKLLDYVSEGKEKQVEEYLDWARSRGLTVVRVLATLHDGFFELSPERGRAALPRLLSLAAIRGLHVEVVGLTETARSGIDPREQVVALGRILARHPNALLELANEPGHSSQSDDVGDPGFLKSLADAVPETVPVALGSIEAGPGFGEGDYVTWHVPRVWDPDGWGHVLAIAAGANLLRQFHKPVVNDEPIGAAATLEAGRRDNDPDRFRAAALLSRLVGLGATFHYEAGLLTRIPAGRELECFNAWSEAWSLLPDGIEHRGVFFTAGQQGAAVRSFDRQTALGVFERQEKDRVWIVAVRPAPTASLRWADGWSVSRMRRFGGVQIIEAARSPKAASRE